MATHIAIDGAAPARAAHPQHGAESGVEDSAFASLLGHGGAQDHQAAKRGRDAERETARAPAQFHRAETPRTDGNAAPGRNADGVRAHGEPQRSSRHHGESPGPGTETAQRLAQLAGRIENAAGLQTAQARIAAIAARQTHAAAVNRPSAAQPVEPQSPPSNVDRSSSSAGAGAERAGGDHAGAEQAGRDRAGAETVNGRFAGHHVAITLPQTRMTGAAAVPVSADNAYAAETAGRNGAGRAAAESAMARGAAQMNESRGQQHGGTDPTLLGRAARAHAASEGRPELRNAIIEKLGEQNARDGRLPSPDSREAGAQQPQNSSTGANRAEAAGRHANAAPSPVLSGGDPIAQSSSTQSLQSQNFDPVLQATSGSGSGTQDAEAASRPANSQPQGRPVPAHVVHEQLAVQIQRASADGQQRMTIRLHPAELGRIEVKLDLAADGSVRALLAVDRPETLDLIQRDVRGLEKALNDAGLKTDSGSLSFDLRGEDSDDDQLGRDDDFDEATGLAVQEAGSEGAGGDGSALAQPRQLVSPGSIDIRI